SRSATRISLRRTEQTAFLQSTPWIRGYCIEAHGEGACSRAQTAAEHGLHKTRDCRRSSSETSSLTLQIRPSCMWLLWVISFQTAARSTSQRTVEITGGRSSGLWAV